MITSTKNKKIFFFEGKKLGQFMMAFLKCSTVTLGGVNPTEDRTKGAALCAMGL